MQIVLTIDFSCQALIIMHTIQLSHVMKKPVYVICEE